MRSRVAAVGETRALEIRWEKKRKQARQQKAAFSDPTARSHITKAAGLRLRLDVRARRMREPDALVKRETKLIIPRHMG